MNKNGRGENNIIHVEKLYFMFFFMILIIYSILRN